MNISQTTKLTLAIGLVGAFGTVSAMEGKKDVSLFIQGTKEDAIVRMISSRWRKPIQEGSVEKVKALITLEADVNEDCGGGCTPLHLATSYQPNPTIIKLLLVAGADPSAKITFGAFKGKTPFETTEDPAIKKAFLTHASVQEVQSLVPLVEAFEKAEQPLTLEGFSRIVALHLVAKKVQAVKEYLPDCPEDQLAKEIEDGIIDALSQPKVSKAAPKEKEEEEGCPHPFSVDVCLCDYKSHEEK